LKQWKKKSIEYNMDDFYLNINPKIKKLPRFVHFGVPRLRRRSLQETFPLPRLYWLFLLGSYAN